MNFAFQIYFTLILVFHVCLRDPVNSTPVPELLKDSTIGKKDDALLERVGKNLILCVGHEPCC